MSQVRFVGSVGQVMSGGRAGSGGGTEGRLNRPEVAATKKWRFLSPPGASEIVSESAFSDLSPSSWGPQIARTRRNTVVGPSWGRTAQTQLGSDDARLKETHTGIS